MKAWFLLLLGLAAFSCHRAQPDFKATKRICGDDADAHAFHYLQLPDMAGDEAPIAFAGINPNIQSLRITSRRCVEIPQDLPPSTVVMGSVTGPRNLAFYFRLEDVPGRTIPLMDTSRWTLESDCQNLGTILGRTDQTQLHYHTTIPHLEEASHVTATLADSNRASIQTEAGWMADE
ncbi:MAG: hypothetical protein M3Q07_25685, partial [Pseudobdellovibrionaceae bacterium]|nr:hypothetical protein [Pseudobdellovibrionaceae bacterium]